MHGAHQPWLAALSVIVAIIASYTALDLAGRVGASDVRRARVWLGGGAVALGTGIWSMHFIGMLAFSLPVAIGFDLEITLLSLAIAVAASALALLMLRRSDTTSRL